MRFPTGHLTGFGLKLCPPLMFSLLTNLPPEGRGPAAAALVPERELCPCLGPFKGWRATTGLRGRSPRNWKPAGANEGFSLNASLLGFSGAAILRAATDAPEMAAGAPEAEDNPTSLAGLPRSSPRRTVVDLITLVASFIVCLGTKSLEPVVGGRAPPLAWRDQEGVQVAIVPFLIELEAVECPKVAGKGLGLREGGLKGALCAWVPSSCLRTARSSFQRCSRRPREVVPQSASSMLSRLEETTDTPRRALTSSSRCPARAAADCSAFLLRSASSSRKSRAFFLYSTRVVLMASS
uniref:Uncharacterized protein n=1 Tax=Ixodes ricinus TaxID=34613 RepID=A0A6B0V6R5_IXORI